MEPRLVNKVSSGLKKPIPKPYCWWMMPITTYSWPIPAHSVLAVDPPEDWDRLRRAWEKIRDSWEELGL